MNRYNFKSIIAGLLLTLLSSGNMAPTFASIDVTFTDVAAEAGIELNILSQGAAFFDENGDGKEDLYLAVGGFISGDNVYYRSRGDLTFEIATAEVNLIDSGPSTMDLVADFNNDGLMDVYVTSHDYLGIPNHMYYRQAGGSYLDVTASTGTGHQYESHDAMAFDYDGDGWLDLFVASANHMGIEPNALYHNNGDGTFTDMAVVLGLDLSEFYGMGGSAGDYDNDGDPDIYIANEFTDNVLFRNDGGTFTDVTATAGVAAAGASKSAYFEDYDADGWLDIYLVSRFGTNQLFRNNGDGTFSDVTVSAGVTDSQQGRTMGWADFDNDGWLDIFVCNSDLPGSNEFLWHNQGDGTFIDEAIAVGINDPYYSDGLSIGDPNGDGFMDIYISNQAAMDRLYVNSGNSNHWISIAPSGRTSTNQAGVGVRVTVVTDTHRQFREVQSGGGYQSHMSLPVEFGMGSSTSADSIIIRWTDGHEEIYTNVAADLYYIAVEDSTLYPFSLPELAISATPSGSVIIPSQGGTIDFNITLENMSGNTLSFDIWTEIRLPNNISFGPTINRALNLPPTIISRDLTQGVPAGAPAGTYTYYAFVGDQSQQSVWTYGSFDFTKSGIDGSTSGFVFPDCQEIEIFGSVDETKTVISPEMKPPSPNPFNPTTVVEFAIPKPDHVKLALFNSMGRKVLDIVDGYRQAGQHQLTVNAGHLPSGVYFLRFEASGISQVSKALLVK
ncbi:hypothetical protein CEE37_05490 [candidate division LCP-89 bacterium B3_LCP]|uniref:ASPIC/UnbV domain-containing protein n=1 Tax=candidate division LCP-89 bacterium B3_LCP TaxID=2012998 RepID=A0A532V1X0_UNCL8|nr:MAG: hypothetical protein CEE37_05490 [candidate division LCP-89 bacterium B3_LCP]